MSSVRAGDRISVTEREGIEPYDAEVLDIETDDDGARLHIRALLSVEATIELCPGVRVVVRDA